MIIQTIADRITNIMVSLIILMPDLTLPAWYEDASTFWNQTAVSIADMAYWVPVSAIANVGIFVFGATAIAVTVKLTRVVLSLFTGGGGGAA